MDSASNEFCGAGTAGEFTCRRDEYGVEADDIQGTAVTIRDNKYHDAVPSWKKFIILIKQLIQEKFYLSI
jgi:hypothetical protein